MKRLINVLLFTTISVVVIACADRAAKFVGTALVDAGQTLRDANLGPSDAAAQDSCATCMVSGPISLAAPVTTLTADTDSKQLVGGSVTFTNAEAWLELSRGPLVVTDFSVFVDPVWADSSATLAIADPGACATKRTRIANNLSGAGYENVRGARLMVPVGKVLCGAGAPSEFYWSGFRPYD